MSLKGTTDPSAPYEPHPHPLDPLPLNPPSLLSLGSPKEQEFDNLIQDESEYYKSHTLTNKIPQTVVSKISNLSKSRTEELEDEHILQKASETEVLELQNYLHIRIQTDIEKVDEITDEYPALEFRQALLRIKHSASDLFRVIISSGWFQLIVIFVILFNTVVLALEDPTVSSQPYPYNAFELFFVIFYTIEFGMIVIANGLWMNSNSYFRDWWNVLDFTILVTAWLSVFAGSGFSLNSLRSIRILRPLRSISSIKGMKVLVLVLMNSVKPLLSAFFILFFFIFLFAIAGVQLWLGELRGTCIYLDSGISTNSGYSCGSEVCEEGQRCVRGLDNPNFGVTSFDNIFISTVTVFQIITLEGWSSVMETTVYAFSYFSVFYYIPLIFIVENLILNFTLAIITISFKDVSATIFEKDDGSERHEEIADQLFQRIYRNTMMMESGVEREVEAKQTLDNTKKCLDDEDEEEKINTPKISKTIKFDTSILSNAKPVAIIGEEYSIENENSIFYDLSEIPFEAFTAIKLNSTFSKTPISKIRPVFHKKTSENYIPQKLQSQFTPSTFHQLPLNAEINQALTEIQPEADPSEKLRENYNKLKSAVTINNQTLKFLKQNPRSIKKTRLELVDGYTIVAESSAEVVPVRIKASNHSFGEFSYLPTDYKDPQIENIYSTIHQVYEKHSEFNSRYKLFRFLSVKHTMKRAFFELELSAKSLVSDKSKNSHITEGCWSGLDIDSTEKPSHSIFANSLSSSVYKIWDEGLLGTLEKIIYPLKVVVMHKYTSYIMLAAVIANTIVLSLDRYGISQTESSNLQSINIFFTYFFTCELFLKIIALGPVQFIRDIMNIFDSVVVLLSLVELFILSGGTSLTAFRAIRIFRIFRVLRIIKIFRYLKSMAIIISSISKSLSSIFYLFLLLALFQIIFTLLGMQVFGGTFNFPTGLPRANFDSFHWAFVTTFQLLSIENWNDVLTSSLRSQIGPVSCLLLIFWIIIGNYILLNLFLAILLDSFNESDEDPVTGVRILKLPTKIQRKIEDLEKNMESDSENEDVKTNKLQSVQLNLLECNKSYWVFNKSNYLRVLCYQISKSQNFENCFLVVILANSLKLVWDTYILDQPSNSVDYQVSNDLDMFFTACFVLEFLIKSIAFGFCVESDSYLRDHWNKLDFSIVVVSVIDLSVSSINVPVIKVFRVLRTLRPLKLIKHNVSMKISVLALFESIGGILNVMFFILIVWLIFAILGVSLLSGKMHYCANQFISDMNICQANGFEWMQIEFNFDNVLQAMVVLFIVMSQESWPNRMLEGVDATSVGQGPIKNYNPTMAYYYCVYLIISNFFLLNLFTVVIFDKFTEAKRDESSLSSLLLSKEQVLWTEIQGMVLKAKPWPVRKKVTSTLRKKCNELSKSKKFEIFIMFFILLNMLSMAMAYEQASDAYNQFLDYVNLICTFMFISEALIKLTGFGWIYFKNNWNKFDFCIVMISVVDVVLTYASISNNAFIRQGPQLIRVLRVIRVVRLLRLIKAFDSIGKLLMILSYALPAIINVLGLLLLVFFVYAVLGCFLFHSVSTGVDVDRYFNFHDFHSSMILLWRMSTGEDYPILMHDFSYSLGNYAYYLFFISFVSITDFIVLELFISIILQYFEEFYTNPYNSLNLFNEDLKTIKPYWISEAKEYYFKIDKEGLIKLIGNVGIDFKFLKTKDKLSAAKLIGVMNIEPDSEGRFYFNDIIYALLRRKYFKKIDKRKFRIDFAIMRIEDVRAKKELQRIREDYSRLNTQNRMKDSIKSREPKTQQPLERNVFFETLLMKSIFNNWRHYTANIEEYDQQITPVHSEVEFPGDISFQDLANP